MNSRFDFETVVVSATARSIDPGVQRRECERLLAVGCIEHDATVFFELACDQGAKQRVGFDEQHERMRDHKIPPVLSTNSKVGTNAEFARDRRSRHAPESFGVSLLHEAASGEAMRTDTIDQRRPRRSAANVSLRRQFSWTIRHFAANTGRSGRTAYRLPVALEQTTTSLTPSTSARDSGRARYRPHDPLSQQAPLPTFALADLDLGLLSRAWTAHIRPVREWVRQSDGGLAWRRLACRPARPGCAGSCPE